MACTQVLDDSVYAPAVNTGKVKAGVLFINGLRHDIFSGENVIGRDEQCDIVISSAAISTRHAVIEVENPETHLIYDAGSTNKSRLGKIIMKPHVRYNLQNGDEIMFANIKATYTKWTETICDSDTGSETGSESEFNCNDDTQISIPFHEHTHSKTDIETLCGSVIEETKADNNDISTMSKSIRSPNTSDFKSNNEHVLCTSSSYMDTPLFQRVKNIGNMPHCATKQDYIVDDSLDDISMISVGTKISTKQTLEASKILQSINEVPESDDEEDFCILSQKTKSSPKTDKKKSVNNYLVQQNISDKSFDDSIDFFDETNIIRTGKDQTFVSSQLQAHTKNNVKHEESLQNFSQCESQSLLTECSNVGDVTRVNDKHLVPDDEETQLPVTTTTDCADKKEETQIPNQSDTSDDSCTNIDSDLFNHAESQSFLGENAESVLNDTKKIVSNPGEKVDYLKSHNLKKVSHSGSLEGNDSKTGVDSKKAISIYDLETQLPESIDDDLHILYEAETQALLKQQKSQFVNNRTFVRDNLRKYSENQLRQGSNLHKTYENDTKIKNLSYNDPCATSAVRKTDNTTNNEDSSIFDADTQVPEELEATNVSEIQEREVTKNQVPKDSSIFDADTQLPEELEAMCIPEIQKHVVTTNQVSEVRSSKNKINNYKKQDTTSRNDNFVFECDTQLPSVTNAENIYDAETQVVDYTSKAKYPELVLSNQPAMKNSDLRKLDDKESNLGSTDELDITTSGDSETPSVKENVTDPFKMPILMKSVTLSNKKRGIKKISETQNIQEDSLHEEDSQKTRCRKGLFQDKTEKPFPGIVSEKTAQVDKNLAGAESSLEEDISDELTQKVIIPASKANISISEKMRDMKNIQNCDQKDISDELTQNISVTNGQTLAVSDKLLGTHSNIQKDQKNDICVNKHYEEDMSDELTQKIPTPKLKKISSTSGTLLERLVQKHEDVMNKTEMDKCDEDISDELTQKVPTPKLNKIPSTSSDVLLERFNQNHANVVNTRDSNKYDEDMSDELTQKIVTPKGKHVPSIPNRLLGTVNKKQVNKIEECDEDISDELTQKIVTYKGKHTPSVSSKLFKTLSKKQKEQVNITQECDKDLSDEVTQKVDILGSNKIQVFSGRKLGMPDREQVDLTNKLLKSTEEDISDELTQKISTPKCTVIPYISNKLFESVNKNQADHSNKMEKCSEDLSDELTQKISTPKSKRIPHICDTTVESLNKTQLDHVNNQGKYEEEDMSDALTQKIRIPVGKQIPSTSDKQLEAFRKKHEGSARREDVNKCDESDLSAEPTQKISTDSALDRQKDQATDENISECARQAISGEPMQEISIQTSKQIKHTSVKTLKVKKDKVDVLNESKGVQSKTKKQISVSKTKEISATYSKVLYTEGVEQPKNASDMAIKEPEDLGISNELIQKLRSCKVKLFSYESSNNGSKQQKNKSKAVETSNHLTHVTDKLPEKLSTPKQKQVVGKAEKHKISTVSIKQHEAEALPDMITHKDRKQKRTLVVSIKREEIDVEVGSDEGKRGKNKTSNSSKHKVGPKKTDSLFSGSNKKQTKITNFCSPLKGISTSTESSNKTFKTSHIFDDSDDDSTDIDDIFIEDEVKKFKERRSSDYLKNGDGQHNSDEENRISGHSKPTSAELKVQKHNSATPERKKLDRCGRSDSPFVLPSLASIKKAADDYYETLSPTKIPDHLRNIDEDSSATTSTGRRSLRIKQNKRKELRYKDSSDQLDMSGEKNNKSVNKRRGTHNSSKSNKTVQKTSGSTHTKESCSNKTQETENSSEIDVLSKTASVDTECAVESKSTSKNNGVLTASSQKTTISTRVPKRGHEKQVTDILTVKDDKSKTASIISFADNTLSNPSKTSHHQIETRRSNSKERTQKEGRKDRNKRNHSPNSNTEHKSKAAKFSRTERKELHESNMCDEIITDSSLGKAGMSRRVTRQMVKGKDTHKNLNESDSLNKTKEKENKDLLKAQLELDMNDKNRRKRKLASALSKDVNDSKLKKLADLSDSESSKGSKITRRSQDESNSRFSGTKSNSINSNKSRETDSSVIYDDISDAGTVANFNNSRGFAGFEKHHNLISSDESTSDSYTIRKSKRLMQSKTTDRSLNSVIANENSGDRRSRNKTVFNDSEDTLHSVATRIQPLNMGSQSRITSSTCERVLFTGMSDPKLEAIIKKLGGAIANNPQDCTVLVTDKVRRTVKLLCTAAQGKPIVTPNWIVKSQAAGHFLDPWQHLIVDKEAERKYNFQLHNVLTECKQGRMLADYSVYITSSVHQPSIPEVKTIIESCGGRVLEKVPSKWAAKSFIISCSEDRSVWKKLERRSVLPPVLESETLLSGVFQNQINFNYHRLC